jgi:hypothetical protein
MLGLPTTHLLPAMLGGDVPIDLDRQAAQREAIAELANPDYRAAQPSWLERAVGWLVDRVTEWATRASEAAPGGLWGLLGLVIVVVVAVVVIRWRIGPVARSAALEFHVDPTIPAATYRQRADQLAASGQWAPAIAERMRAIVRAAEERGLADARPGRTADELAALIAEQAPTAGADMVRAADVFDRVRYGGRPGDPRGYQQLVAADEALSHAPRVRAQVRP